VRLLHGGCRIVVGMPASWSAQASKQVCWRLLCCARCCICPLSIPSAGPVVCQRWETRPALASWCPLVRSCAWRSTTTSPPQQAVRDVHSLCCEGAWACDGIRLCGRGWAGSVLKDCSSENRQLEISRVCCKFSHPSPLAAPTSVSGGVGDVGWQ
jgi:hypothetical protein